MAIRHTQLSGQEVLNGYAEITSDFVYSTDNNITDVTALAITFTPLQALVQLKMGGGYIQQNTTAATPTVYLTDSANTILAFCTETVITGALLIDFGMKAARVSLTPGASVTYKVRIKRGTAGASSVSLAATTLAPAWIQAVYL